MFPELIPGQQRTSGGRCSRVDCHRLAATEVVDRRLCWISDEPSLPFRPGPSRFVQLVLAPSQARGIPGKLIRLPGRKRMHPLTAQHAACNTMLLFRPYGHGLYSTDNPLLRRVSITTGMPICPAYGEACCQASSVGDADRQMKNGHTGSRCRLWLIGNDTCVFLIC